MSKTTEEDAARDMVSACRDLYDAVDRLDTIAANRVGISRNDLRALNALEHGPVKPKDLAESLGLTTGAVTSLIDRLEKRKLVVRASDPDDRRGVLVVPTDIMFAELAPLYREVAIRVSELADSYGTTKARLAASMLRDIASVYASAGDGMT